MKRIKVLVLRTGGTNCDVETAFAFEKAGASCRFMHINSLIAHKRSLERFHILALSGGFTYGDDIASGKILANQIKFQLREDIVKFIKHGKLILGICNGFQVLVKSGLLPNLTGDFSKLESTLSINDSGKFEDRWVYLKRVSSRCVWTRGIDPITYLPVAHGEGKFMPGSQAVLEELEEEDRIAFTYCDKNGKEGGYPVNPNGSVENIAGICDKGGRVFGLMPHPERHITHTQNPRWTRPERLFQGGLDIFRNGVRSASKL